MKSRKRLSNSKIIIKILPTTPLYATSRHYCICTFEGNKSVISCKFAKSVARNHICLNDTVTSAFPKEVQGMPKLATFVAVRAETAQLLDAFVGNMIGTEPTVRLYTRAAPAKFILAQTGLPFLWDNTYDSFTPDP